MANITFVDHDDRPVGKGTTQEAIEKGYIFRVARVMIADGQGRFLLQRRTDHLALFPGRWDNSAAGKVDEGESYLRAAERELQEELGISGIHLTPVGSYYSELTYEEQLQKRFNKVFEARYKNEPISVNADEVSQTKWFSVKELAELLRASPEQFTDGVIDYFTNIRPLKR